MVRWLFNSYIARVFGVVLDGEMGFEKGIFCGYVECGN